MSYALPHAAAEKGHNDELSLKTVTPSEWITASSLLAISLICNIECIALAGCIKHLQFAFDLDDKWTGFISSSFMFTYGLFAPWSQYFCQWYDRKALLVNSLVLWSICGVMNAYTYEFWSFIIFRSLIGITVGCIVATIPSVFEDMFKGGNKVFFIELFVITRPAGIGLGYIVGSLALSQYQDWSWCLRFTPWLCMSMALFYQFMGADLPSRSVMRGKQSNSLSYTQILKQTLYTKTFLLASLSLVFVFAAFRSNDWWLALFLETASFVQPCRLNFKSYQAARIVGYLYLTVGILGIPISTLVYSTMKKRWRITLAYMIMINLGLMITCYVIGLVITMWCLWVTVLMIFFAGIFCHVALFSYSDFILSAMDTTSRAAAVGLQSLAINTLGSSLGPFAAGLITDRFLVDMQPLESTRLMFDQEVQSVYNYDYVRFVSLKNGLMLVNCVMVICGIVVILIAHCLIRGQSRITLFSEKSRETNASNSE